jgi:tRNA pseudouridine38-40 synthase
VRVKVTLAYDGTGFHGWARQPGQRTVEGEVRAAVEQV